MAAKQVKAPPVPASSAPVLHPTVIRWPPREPFLLSLRFAHVVFPGGGPPDSALWIRSPGGAAARVLVGSMARSRTPVALKVLLASNPGGISTDREAFIVEAEMLNHLRSEADIVRTRDECGVPLSIDDRGALHIAYAYGAGEEEELTAVNASLPPGPAFLLAVEPLKETLTARICRAPAGRLAIADVLRTLHGIALGLAFLGKHRVVVRV